ncbi:glycosyltransferase [Methylomonas montana]|uniref:glycosyltransferase n=1 Tax=Methylomonas montana TaxID=3058963 RepID=UPI00265956DC|nr:glycosyltransferase [Methylomonas montana]WKJ88631.1 glycosyltransferase [Methylomonas montana]
MNLSPVVLFVYNRPWHTRQTIEALQKNELAFESELIIYSDAPKNDDSRQTVMDVRSYIKSIQGFKKITIIEREKNWGLSKSIIDGVTTIVNQYGKIIVLEDDLVTSRFFLKFMNEALNFYQNEKKVFHISGYVYPINTKNIDSTFFLKPTTCWGWGTWDRAWKYFVKDSDLYLCLFNKKMIYDYNLSGAYRYFDQIRLNKKGRIDTWAVFWYASSFLNSALSLHPKDSFVRNIGHDGFGVNCTKSSVFDVEVVDYYDVIFTTNICENIKARKSFECFFNGLKKTLFKRIYNKARNILR